MSTGGVLILDHDTQRRARAGERLRALQITVIEAPSAHIAITRAHHDKPDLILFHIGPGADVPLFQKIAAEFPGTFVVPFIERNFSEKLRSEVLALKAPGFLNDDLPNDEWVAAIRALLRQKRALEDHNGVHRNRRSHGHSAQNTGVDLKENGAMTPLRERAPELYQAVLSRYEEAIKKVLQHRIYKITDDVFEPFRMIAKELFLANATARDAVELHYQTLRKIAPTPDAPRAQGYLEVGRTTIVGLMGDLLTYYRDGRTNGVFDKSNDSNAAAHSRSDSAQR